MNHCVLPELVRMVSFDRGFDSDYAVSLGAGNKYLPRLLPAGELAGGTACTTSPAPKAVPVP